MKKITFLISLFVSTICLSQTPIDHPAYNGTYPSISNVTYDSPSNNCNTKSFKATWNDVLERWIDSYSLQVYDNSNKKWKTIKTVPKSGKSTYSTTVSSLSQSWVKSGSYELRVRINIKPSAYVDGIRYWQGAIEKVASKKSSCVQPPAGKPNLRLKSLVIKNTTTSSTLYNYPNGSTNTPTLKKDNWYDFIVSVENNGAGSASSVSLDILFTYNDRYPNTTFYSVASDSDIGDIDPARSTSKTFSVFVSYNIGVSPTLSNNSSYFLNFDIDAQNKISETKEDDNISTMLFTYSSGSGKPGDPDGDCTFCPQAKQDSTNKPYNLQVFNFTGQKIIDRMVKNINEENQIIENLPKKLYIVKSKNGDRKISY